MALPHYVRLTCTAVLLEINREYVNGISSGRCQCITSNVYNILPNCFAPLIVQAFLGFSNAILNMAALGFLGMGAQPPTPE